MPWVGGGSGGAYRGHDDPVWKPRTVEDSIDAGVHPAVAKMRREAMKQKRTVEDAIVGRKVQHIISQNKAPGVDLDKTNADPSFNPKNFFKQASKLGVNPLEAVSSAACPGNPADELAEKEKEKKTKKSKKKEKKEKRKKKKAKKSGKSKKKGKKKKGSSSSSSSSSASSSSSSSSSSEDSPKAAKGKRKAEVIVISNTMEEIEQAEKLQKKQRRRQEKELKMAAIEAERAELERKLFGADIHALAAKSMYQATTPMRPEIGQMIMEEDERRARMLCGECRGGKQHSGINM